MKQRKSEVQILKSLKERGYVRNMIISGDRLFIDSIEGSGLPAEACTVEEEYRFEGMSNPSDMSIIYAVSTDNGALGTVVVNYGPQSDTEAAEFFRKTNYAVNS